MKKYVKPDVLFEDFEMSVGVAACDSIILDSQGNVKECTDPGFKHIIDAYNLFAGAACTVQCNNDNLQQYGYYGSTANAIFGSV